MQHPFAADVPVQRKLTQEVQNDPFIEAARELGCDPDDPRVAEVLKAMAAQPPKRHETLGEGKSVARKKKRPAPRGE